MAYDPQNVFARILRGELPCHKVHEDDHTLTFMDLMPQADGHTLVIPKAAAESLLDLAPEALAPLSLMTQRVARAVKAATGAPGVMIAQLNGEAAGQTVFHIHFHVIPRYSGAEMKIHAREPADAAELAAMAEKIRAAFV